MSNIPKLRFKEFSGEWEEKKLGDVVTNKSQKYNSEKDKTAYKCIELEHLAPEIGKLLGFSESIDAGSIKNKFSAGDVLFGKLRPYLKKYLQPSFNGVCSSEIWVLKGTGISNNFLFSLIQTKQFIDLANQSSGSKMPRADWSVVSNGDFCIPQSKDEQQKIASFLSAVDTKIDQLTRKKELLEQYKKGMMQKIFSQELRFKADDGSEFPEWEEKKLGEIGEFRGGGTPSKNIDEYWIGAIPWISSSDIVDNNIHDINISRFINEKAIQESATKIIPPNSVLFVSRVGVGKIAVSKTELCTSQDFTNFIPTNCLSYFLGYFFLANKNVLRGFNQGTSIKGFTKSDLETLVVNFPCFEEQTKIANFLSAIDTKIDFVVKQLDEAKNFKKGLLQQMFV